MERKRFDNVFDALGFEPEEAAELTAKTDLAIAIHRRIDALGLTREQAEQRIGLAPGELAAILDDGDALDLTIDALTGYLTRLGQNVVIEIIPATTEHGTVTVSLGKEDAHKRAS